MAISMNPAEEIHNTLALVELQFKRDGGSPGEGGQSP